MVERRKPTSPGLGRAGAIEKLVREGRIPQFELIEGVGVRCIVPGLEGEEPQVTFLTPGNATQISRRLQHVLHTQGMS